MGSCLNATAVHQGLTNILYVVCCLNERGREDPREVDTFQKKKKKKKKRTGRNQKTPLMEKDHSTQRQGDRRLK